MQVLRDIPYNTLTSASLEVASLDLASVAGDVKAYSHHKPTPLSLTAAVPIQRKRTVSLQNIRGDKDDDARLRSDDMDLDANEHPHYHTVASGAGAGAGAAAGSSATAGSVEQQKQRLQEAIDVAVDADMREAAESNWAEDSLPSSPTGTTAKTLASVIPPTSSAAGTHFRKLCGRRSKHVTHPKHHLDLFIPNPTEPRQNKYPVVIYVHGGGWMRGDKSSEWRGGPVFGRWAAQNNMVAAVISYRLSPPALFAVILRSFILSLILGGIYKAIPISALDVLNYPLAVLCFWIVVLLVFLVYVLGQAGIRHPDQVSDVARAIRWVYSSLPQHCPQADISRVFLSGHSAGAHLIMLATMDPQFLDREHIPRDFIKGVAPVSGVYNLISPLNPSEFAFKNYFFRASYTRSVFGNDPDVWRSASPFFLVESYVAYCAASHHRPPPFLLISASNDLGLETDAERMYQKMRDSGLNVQWHTVKNTSHASIASKFHTHDASRHFLEFIQTVTKQLDEASQTASLN